MTSKERLLSVLRGQNADRIPWAPFLTYWWDQNLVREAEKLGELGFKRAVGCDLLMRGHFDRKTHVDYRDAFVFRISYATTEIEEIINGFTKRMEYKTPIGTLIARYIYSPDGNTWFLTEHPVKTEQDFLLLAYIARDMLLRSDSSDFCEESINNPDTLFVPLISPFTKTAFQSMIEYWVGTEELTYALMDYPEVVAHALTAMQETSFKAAAICAQSPGDVFISWEDTSTTNISPDWYERYILPEINHWCDVLHEKGKLYIQHACGHLRALAPLIAQSKIDAIESVSSKPTGNISPWELKDLLPKRIAIIGGIEPTFFIGATIGELVEHVAFLQDQFKGRRFILANADSCPPAVDINRFGVVSNKVLQLANMEPIHVPWFDQKDLIAKRGNAGYHGSPKTKLER